MTRKARSGRAWSNRELLTVPLEPIEAEWRAPTCDTDGFGRESLVRGGEGSLSIWLAASPGGCMRGHRSAADGKDAHAA